MFRRHPLDLVEDHQLLCVPGQVKCGIAQLLAIRCVLKVKIGARPLFGDKPGQRGLACLARAEEGHGRELVQPSANHLLLLTRIHPSIYGIG